MKIAFADIDHIESVEDYLKIHLTTSRPVMTLMTMKAVLDKLPPLQFATFIAATSCRWQK